MHVNGILTVKSMERIKESVVSFNVEKILAEESHLDKRIRKLTKKQEEVKKEDGSARIPNP